MNISLKSIFTKTKKLRYRKDIFEYRIQNKSFSQLWRILEKFNKDGQISRCAMKYIKSYYDTFDVYDQKVCIRELYTKIFIYLNMPNVEKWATYDLEVLIKKYGDVVGAKLYDDRFQKISKGIKKAYSDGRLEVVPDRHPGFPEYWSKRFNISIEDAKLYMSNKSKENIKKTIEWLRQNGSCREVRFWTGKGYSEADAVQKVYDVQSRNLKYFIGKYGIDEGTERHSLRTKRWIKGLQNGFGENYKTGISMWESSVVKKLLEKLHDSDIVDDNFRYGKYQLILSNGDKSFYSYDFASAKYKFVLECNGRKFHPHPNYEDAWGHPFNEELSYNDALVKDDMKKVRTEIEGYRVFYVWDFFSDVEYDNVFNKIVEYCKENEVDVGI